MKYKITIETLTENSESKYPDKETIYEQTVETVDLKKVVAIVNEYTQD